MYVSCACALCRFELFPNERLPRAYSSSKKDTTYATDMQRHFRGPLTERGFKIDPLFKFDGFGSCQQRETTWEFAPFADCGRCISPACLPDSTMCGASWHEHEWRPDLVARYCETKMKRYISKGMGVTSSGYDEYAKRVALTNFTSPPGPWAVATLRSLREWREAKRAAPKGSELKLSLRGSTVAPWSGPACCKTGTCAPAVFEEQCTRPEQVSYIRRDGLLELSGGSGSG